MKWTAMLGAAAAFLVLTGCDTPDSSLLSLEQVAGEQDAVMAPALLGMWAVTPSSEEFCVIRPDDTNGYRVLFVGGAPIAFSARLFAVGDARFLELTPETDNSFLIPAHVVARIWASGTELRWSFLDSDWFKEQAQALSHFSPDKKLVLTAPGGSVRALIAKLGADERAHGAVTTWQRAQ